MKKASLLILTAISLLILSCESTNETINNPAPVTDEYRLLTVTSEGGVFEIGNNTGTTTKVGQITNQANLIMLPSVCNTGTKIYALEATYVPNPNILIVYNKTTGTTNTVQLTLPSSITSSMTDPFVNTLEYNGTELIAVVNENMPNNTRPNKIISINLQTYEVTDLEISFFQRIITSTAFINNNLYLTTSQGFLKINLIDKYVTEIMRNGQRFAGTRIANIDNSKIALMEFGIPVLSNGVKPFECNIDNNTFTDKSSGHNFGTGNINGDSVFYHGEFLNIVFREDSSFGLLKLNYQNSAINFVPLSYNQLGGNTVIADIID